MKDCRKNASSLSMTSDTIYIFGGSSCSELLSSIEQYSVSANKWHKLRITLPKACAFMNTFKLSDTEILILGGSARDSVKH
mmetsp:Transcript_11779/g.8209  ORF Transcript_11779/g.8209 Transcript_11779/m.8209 type:complete len:81 (-) Transcript_11779:260-502(-)